MQGPNLDANIQMSSTDVPLLLHSLLSVHSQLRGGGGVLPRYKKVARRTGLCLKAAPQRYPQLSMQFVWFAKRGKHLIQPLGCCESMQQCPLNG